MTDKEHANNLLKAIKKHGITAQGQNELVRHLEGGLNHRASALKAKCYDCTGYYANGKVDCECELCPLYPFMPYKDKKSQI